MNLKVNEIFYSIQGESTFAGLPCIFIRLTGCNLRCSYCDTEYSYFEGSEQTIDSIIEKISEYPTSLVLITGGEPLCQDNSKELLTKLADLNYSVLIETNGTQSLKDLDKRCIKIMDIKCPDSGVMGFNFSDNIKYLNENDQIKFVISSKKDFDFAVTFIKKHLKNFNGENIILSAVKNKLSLSSLAEWILNEGITVRLQIQIHKFIWPDTDRGV